MGSFHPSSGFNIESFIANNSFHEFFVWAWPIISGSSVNNFSWVDDHEYPIRTLAITGSFEFHTDNGWPSDGTITGLTYQEDDATIFSLSGVSITVAQFYAFSDADDLGGLFQALLAGDDTIFAPSGNETLHGYDGNDVIFGNGGDDTLSGDNGNDLMSGGSGNDVLNGGSGADLLGEGSAASGTYGNDRYDGGSGRDTVIYSSTGPGVTVDLTNAAAQNTGQGTDTILNVESVEATAGNDHITGTAQANWIATFAGNDTISAGDGDDLIWVGGGDKAVDGGSGINTVMFSHSDTDLTYQNADGVSVSLAVQGQAQATGTGSWTLNGIENLGGAELDDRLTGNGNGNILAGGLGNDRLVGGGGDDRLYGDGTWTVDANGDQQLLATGRVGDIGGDDIMNGGDGADLMAGGGGNDTYYVDNAGDQVIEAANDGEDTVSTALTYRLGANVEDLILTGSASVSGTGNALANSITGNSASNRLSGGAGADRLVGAGGNDILDGGTGDDVMRGGVGNDRYYVDSSADSVIENSGEGTDSVYSSASFSLGANVEELILTGTAANGTGNALNNRIVGDAANNILDGGAGTDVLRGGLGDDTYYVDNSNDRAIENSGQGTDTVISSVTYAIAGNVENLTLTGSAFRANGNIMANHLVGTSSNNILNGAGGADVMTGGAGNDTYFVDNAGDTVTENSGEGTDRVYTTVSYTAAANVEDIFIRGAGSVDATGNDLGNSIRGNGANNVITGGAGLDRVTGGGGADTFVFHDGDFAGMGPGTADQIRDFSTLQGDRIDLSGVDANTGLFGDQAFAFIGSAAFHNVAGELRYDIVNGTTYVYGDTNGDGVSDFMIRLDGNHTMSASDFVI